MSQRKVIRLDKYHSEVLRKALKLFLLRDNDIVFNNERKMAKDLLGVVDNTQIRNASLEANVKEEEE